MSVEMIEHRYKLPGEVWLRFFANLAAFAKHIQDHFASSQEPWCVVFGKNLCDRLANVSAYDLQDPNLPGLYAEVVEHLHQGILFAQERPVYVRLGQDRGDGPRPTLYLVAPEGYLIVARDGQVRSAYFPNSSPGDSAHNRFRATWLFVKQKAERSDYTDRKGGESVRQTGVQWVSESNWAVCPNPHPRKLEAPVEVSHA